MVLKTINTLIDVKFWKLPMFLGFQCLKATQQLPLNICFVECTEITVLIWFFESYTEINKLIFLRLLWYKSMWIFEVDFRGFLPDFPRPINVIACLAFGEQSRWRTVNLDFLIVFWEQCSPEIQHEFLYDFNVDFFLHSGNSQRGLLLDILSTVNMGFFLAF